MARNSSSTTSASQRSEPASVLDPAGLDLVEQGGVGHEEERLRQRRLAGPLAVADRGPLGAAEDPEDPREVGRRHPVRGDLDGPRPFRGVGAEIARRRRAPR